MILLFICLCRLCLSPKIYILKKICSTLNAFGIHRRVFNTMIIGIKPNPVYLHLPTAMDSIPSPSVSLWLIGFLPLYNSKGNFIITFSFIQDADFILSQFHNIGIGSTFSFFIYQHIFTPRFPGIITNPQG